MKVQYTLQVTKQAEDISACMEKTDGRNYHPVNEKKRYTFTRPGLVVTCIVCDLSITESICKLLTISFFDSRKSWHEVNLGERR